MKSIAYLIGASMLALVSCSGNKEQKDCIAENGQDAVVESANYVGILPAADGAGIAYDLTFEPVADAGNYYLTQQYNGQDTVIYITKGAYQLLSDTAVQPNGKYYRLISVSEPGDTLYFAVSSDSTLTMLTPTLQQADSGLDYVLTKKND